MTIGARVEWGDPRPADSIGPREPLAARLPPWLVREVRAMARSRGISVSLMMQRLLEAGMEGRPVSGGPGHADLVTTLFD